MLFGMPYLLECGSPEGAAALCRELGLDFLELNLSFPDCTLAQLTPERLTALRERYGIVLTFHLDELLNPCAYEPAIREAWHGSVRRAIGLAREVGAPSVNLHWERGVYVTLPDRVVYMNQMYREAYLAQVLAFRQVCAEASRGRVNVCVENTDGWLPFQREAIELLLEEPCFGLTLDIGHSHCTGGTDEDFFAAHADRLRHMHAHDARGSKCHNAFGTGDIDLRSRLSLAKRAGANVVLEVKTVEALRQTVSRLPAFLPKEDAP